MYISIFYVFSYSFMKNLYFLWSIYKEKHISRKGLILAPNFIFLHSSNVKLFFHGKTLRTRKMRRCTRDFFV
jgi:hypothetical protein